MEESVRLKFGPTDGGSDSGSMPSPGVDGAIPVSKDGVWEVGVDKDAKAKSLQAQEGLSGASVQAGALITSDGEGNTTQIEPDGTVTVNAQEIDLKTISGGSVDPRTNGGRLAVTPAYMNTASDSAFQANATDDRILFGWTQEVAHTLSALSIYVTAVGTQGNITLGLYTADSDGEPDTLVFDIGTVDSGASADAWIRKTFTAQQLYPGTRYCIVASVAVDKDVSFSYNRQDAGQYSGLVPGCWSKSTVNGGTDWTDVTKDSLPALLNIVLESTENHVPQLVYGWDGKHGNKIALYNTDTSAWELKTIANAGYFADVSSETADIALNVFAQWDITDFILSLDINLGRTFQDGIEIVGGGDGDRFLGIMAPVNRISTYQAPIRCDTANTLWNADNQTEQVGYRGFYDIYFAASGVTGGNVWTKYGVDNWTLVFVCGVDCAVEAVVTPFHTSDAYGRLSIGMDSVVAPARGAVTSPISSYPGPSFFKGKLPEGLHNMFPIRRTQDAANEYYSDTTISVAVSSALSIKYMG